MAAVMVVAVATQLVGGSLLPATRGFTVFLPTAACLFSVGFGAFLLARLITLGAPLSLLIPVSAVMLQITGVLVGVFVYHETASLPRIICLVVAAFLVGAAGLL
jgi:multidrug transporter EmrE-like cation transporter